MRLPLVFVLLVLPVTLPAGNGADIDPRRYFGTYLFEDGVRVSGGRFDEAGRQLLLYMDTEHGRRGLPLVRGENRFVPAFGLPGPVRVTFHDGGDSMHWLQADGEVLQARRVMQPVFREAVFSNGNVALRGTLYLPPGANQPLPAIILVHGSGDASQYAGTWATFFLEQGMAVLAYDKRGVGESGGDWKRATYLDLAGDVDAAVKWLARQPMIDAKRIGIHTSSQSGWYGPRVALVNDGIAFLIQRAGPAVPIDAGTAHEIREEWRSEGMPGDVIEPAIAFWLELHALAATRASLEAANDLLHEARSRNWFGASFGAWEAIAPGWWHRHSENMQLDPASDAGRLEIPILWFLAEQDENVPYRASLEALIVARKRNDRLEIVTVDNAAHSFLVTDEEGRVHYTPEYWPVMVQWLREQSIIR